MGYYSCWEERRNNKQSDINLVILQAGTFKYGLVDDDLRMNGFTVSLGVVIPMYKPRRKNTVTLQTIMKGWFTKKEKDDE